MRRAYKSIGRDELKRYFQGDFMETVDSIIEKSMETQQLWLSKENRQFLCLFLTEAIVGMLVRYIEDSGELERKVTIDTIPDLLRITITGFISERGEKKK